MTGTYYGKRSEVVRYGPNVPAENELRLLGTLTGKRVLELGSGSRSSAVAMAKQGAHVIAVDPHPERVAEARVLAEDEEVRIEWHEGALSDLAFLRADSVDVAFSAGAISEVEDIGRLFRQVHRVLQPGGPFVFAFDHPAAAVARGQSYFDETPFPAEVDGATVTTYPRSIATVFTALIRTSYRVECVLEPEPPTGDGHYPSTVVFRARKEGA